jgi:hypothetical protein
MKQVDTRQLIDCIIERRPNADIYWYHWPRDGIFPWEDFEPVVYAYGHDSEDLCLVILRVGWKYKVSGADDLTYPIVVMFETPQHHPLLRTKHNAGTFDARTVALARHPSRFVQLQGPLPRLTVEGPAMFRRNIYDEIEKLRAENCRPHYIC